MEGPARAPMATRTAEAQTATRTPSTRSTVWGDAALMGDCSRKQESDGFYSSLSPYKIGLLPLALPVGLASRTSTSGKSSRQDCLLHGERGGGVVSCIRCRGVMQGRALVTLALQLEVWEFCCLAPHREENSRYPALLAERYQELEYGKKVAGASLRLCYVARFRKSIRLSRPIEAFDAHLDPGKAPPVATRCRCISPTFRQPDKQKGARSSS